ncbi:hypothetical protein CLAFUW4_06063 [Fulvia fulva]|uniref:Integrase catalytic domain-containing protein n=1 Tax=Passalora fulva TaxID=5499 RepID=A0A9Q8LIJ6_PASFU|nr:uncharacterized protein CLAFUR5_06207 [Fulvia fulva]KAK4624377.1 hypothetical protein CLAFUR4_06067 [Fulvia fulva]KAK4625228.1 hypothetical protein CLAFUR0_06071 [Fulvia fulva]UJO18025.1 hypothetical protein CLAFUR5_06207 [Fulvia fulva]WPV15143.1 hypothetical protein CLAFUW4_06063 [Fulvia fulva]WPV30585.1 hypothetical protein CLAFUW7_06060 [Fulvia fulva]
MDWVGPLPTTRKGNRSILHLIDYFSRFSITKATKTNTPEDTIESLKSAWAIFPAPAAIYADPGKHYIARKVVTFVEGQGVLISFSPSGASRPVGMVEKENDVLQRAIMRSASIELDEKMREYASDHTDWDVRLPQHTRSINSRYIDHLGYSPAEISFGCKPADMAPMELRLPTPAKAALRH